MKIPLAVVIGAIPGISFALSAPDGQQKFDRLVGAFTGYVPSSGQFSRGMWAFGLYPLLAGVGFHILANAFGLNRMIGKWTKGLPVEI